MTVIEESDRTCTDCGSQLWVHNRKQYFGCDECGKAWTMERLDDFGTDKQMPPENDSYSSVFN